MGCTATKITTILVAGWYIIVVLLVDPARQNGYVVHGLQNSVVLPKKPRKGSSSAAVVVVGTTGATGAVATAATAVTSARTRTRTTRLPTILRETGSNSNSNNAPNDEEIAQLEEKLTRMKEARAAEAAKAASAAAAAQQQQASASSFLPTSTVTSGPSSSLRSQRGLDSINMSEPSVEEVSIDMFLSEKWKERGAAVAATQREGGGGGSVGGAGGAGNAGGVLTSVLGVVAVAVLLAVFSQVPIGQENLSKYSAIKAPTELIDLGDLNRARNSGGDL
jgi:hypothetical protein